MCVCICVCSCVLSVTSCLSGLFLIPGQHRLLPRLLRPLLGLVVCSVTVGCAGVKWGGEGWAGRGVRVGGS